MKAIAIIPARGGSKRIPGKNIKNFLGKPIIAYSIEAALNLDLFEEVMVSTDDEEIASVAKKYGARVPFLRSKKNSDDFATTVDVLAEVLEDYKTKESKTFSYGCCIYPTAPLVTEDKLKAGYHRLTSDNFDSVFPVVAFGYPIWRGLQTDQNRVKTIWPEFLNSRSQDLKKVFHDAGQWYWFKTMPLITEKKLFTENSGYVELKETEVQDIDNEVDWELAELKYQFLKQKQ